MTLGWLLDVSLDITQLGPVYPGPVTSLQTPARPDGDGELILTLQSDRAL